jgi:colanic acid/amylovoran biosynthesis protein
MKIMMFAHAGSLNRGCEAIVRSSTTLIKDKIKDAKVFLASDNPETDQGIASLDGIYDGSKMEIPKFSYPWYISSLNVKLLKNESYALGKIHSNIIRRIKDVDICLSIGGDNYCYGEQPGWYEIDKRVKQQGKKLVLWGCSIGEEDMSDAKFRDLKSFDLILARETLTYEMLKDRGLNNIKLCADPAFTLNKDELDLPKGWQEGNTIGLNFSPLVESRNPGSRKAIHDLIKHILTKTDSTIVLTPHVMEKGNNDYELLLTYYDEYKDTGRIIILPDDLNAEQYKGYISRMKFFIGARTHATIAAYSQYVPTMVLGYSVKSKGIAKDLFGEEKLVLGIDRISNSQMLISSFNEMIEEEESIKERLRESVPNIKKMSHIAADYLYKIIS